MVQMRLLLSTPVCERVSATAQNGQVLFKPAEVLQETASGHAVCYEEGGGGRS